MSIGSSPFRFLTAEWEALCTFKALQKIKEKLKRDTPSSVDGLTKEEFCNLYEALKFKWVPHVRHNCTLQKKYALYIYL